MRRNGASDEEIARYKKDFAMADAAAALGASEETGDKIASATGDKIVSATFRYGLLDRDITITSEGSRHWRRATVYDRGSIVFMVNGDEFGKFDDLGSDTNEFEESISTAIVHTFSGKTEKPWASDDTFDGLLVVPEGILNGIKNEAPPGRFFSGRSVTNTQSWSPAPDGEVWKQHPLLKEPTGMYFPDEAAFYVDRKIEFGSLVQGRSIHLEKKAWWEWGELAYWCPVLKRCICKGEMLRLEHWFHNGDGSAQQRYFYNQNEMLDMHGGLDGMPSDDDRDAKGPAMKKQKST